MKNKKRRIVIFADTRGTCTARNTRNYTRDAWKVELFNVHTRGFRVIGDFIIPKRIILKLGWYPFYQEYLKYLIYNKAI